MNKEDKKRVEEVSTALGRNPMDITVKTEHVDKDGNLQTSEHEVAGKPITVIVHDSSMEVSLVDDDIFTITATDTVAFADAIDPKDWGQARTIPQFEQAYRGIFGTAPPFDLKTAPVACKHVIGLIALMGKALEEDKRPFLKLPETYLHPAQQAGLASFLAKFTSGK